MSNPEPYNPFEEWNIIRQFHRERKFFMKFPTPEIPNAIKQRARDLGLSTKDYVAWRCLGIDYVSEEGQFTLGEIIPFSSEPTEMRRHRKLLKQVRASEIPALKALLEERGDFDEERVVRYLFRAVRESDLYVRLEKRYFRSKKSLGPPYEVSEETFPNSIYGWAALVPGLEIALKASQSMDTILAWAMRYKLAVKFSS